MHDKWTVCCNRMAARQWWRRLVNAYEVKAGLVFLQCDNCVIHTRALQRRASHNGALYKSIFLFIFYGKQKMLNYKLWLQTNVKNIERENVNLLSHHNVLTSLHEQQVPEIQPTNQPINQLINQSINQPTNQPTSQSINQSINQPASQINKFVFHYCVVKKLRQQHVMDTK